MIRELQSLFDSLPSIYKKDPVAQLAARISFGFPQTKAYLTVDGFTLDVDLVFDSIETDMEFSDRTFRITNDTAGSLGFVRACESLSYDLRAWSIGALMEDIASHQGYTATLLDPTVGTLLASALIDGANRLDLSTPVDLSIATNPLWVFMKAVAYAIADEETNTDTALDQLNVLKAAQYFADVWGDRLGVLRNTGESDSVYTQRIVDTILRKRENSLAIEQLIADTFGVVATVEDLWPLVLNFNNRVVFSKLPGNVFNVANFLVTVPLIGQTLIELVNAQKAGGTRAFFIEQHDTGFVDTITISEASYDLSIFDNDIVEMEFCVSLDEGGNRTELDIGLPNWNVEQTIMPGSLIA